MNGAGAVLAALLAAGVAGCSGITNTAERDAPARGGVATSAKTGVEIAGHDEKWQPHAAYLKRVIRTVQKEWQRAQVEQNVSATSGTQVRVTFVLDADGKVAQIVDVETTASDAATRACLSAITDRMPYGAWTPEMKRDLGEAQQMTFSFFYQ